MVMSSKNLVAGTSNYSEQEGWGEKLPSKGFMDFNSDIHFVSRWYCFNIGSKLYKKRWSGSFLSVLLFSLNFFSIFRKRKSISSLLLLRAFFLTFVSKKFDKGRVRLTLPLTTLLTICWLFEFWDEPMVGSSMVSSEGAGEFSSESLASEVGYSSTVSGKFEVVFREVRWGIRNSIVS